LSVSKLSTKALKIRSRGLPAQDSAFIINQQELEQWILIDISLTVVVFGIRSNFIGLT
jgi:hypothetical protein